MCGRFASARKRQELLAEFQIERDRVSDSLEPDYNVAPTKPVYGVLSRGQRDGERRPDEGVARELRVLRWGLVPSWAKDASIGSRLINARAETVDAKPSFRRPFARRRCLLPADGFYEWITVEEDGKPRKQPYFIHRADGGILAFAGLYELWRDKSFPDDHPKAWLWSAVIITTRSEDEVGRIHDRMPMIIEPARWAEWLDPASTDAAHLHTLLEPAAVGRLASYPVSTQVNSVRNNGPTLIDPLPSPGPGESDGPDGGPGSGQGGGRSGSGPNGGRSRSGPTPGRPGPAAMSADPPAAARDRHRRPITAPLTLF